jgi:hypothetical protein
METTFHRPWWKLTWGSRGGSSPCLRVTLHCRLSRIYKYIALTKHLWNSWPSLRSRVPGPGGISNWSSSSSTSPYQTEDDFSTTEQKKTWVQGKKCHVRFLNYATIIHSETDKVFKMNTTSCVTRQNVEEIKLGLREKEVCLFPEVKHEHTSCTT